MGGANEAVMGRFTNLLSIQSANLGEDNMAIVCSKNGTYFDIPDADLVKYMKKAESVDLDVGGRSDEGSCSEGTCDSGKGAPGGFGAGLGGPGGGVSPVQIIVNYIQPGAGGGGGMPAGQGTPGAKGGQDIAGRYCGWANCWRNFWRNCWRNFVYYY